MMDTYNDPTDGGNFPPDSEIIDNMVTLAAFVIANSRTTPSKKFTRVNDILKEYFGPQGRVHGHKANRDLVKKILCEACKRSYTTYGVIAVPVNSDFTKDSVWSNKAMAGMDIDDAKRYISFPSAHSSNTKFGSAYYPRVAGDIFLDAWMELDSLFGSSAKLYKKLPRFLKKLEEGSTTPEFIGRIIPHVLTISMAALHFEPKFISALFDPEQKHLLTKEYILTSCAKFMPKDENEEAEVVDEVPSGLEDPCDLEDQE